MFTFQFPILWYAKWYGDIITLVYWFVCMLPTFLKIYWTKLHEIFKMICHHPRTNRLDIGSDQVKGQGYEKVKNYRTELHDIFRNDLSSSKHQSIRFWERSGQKSRSRSQKGQKRILVITCSVFVRFIWNKRQNVHFSIPYPLANLALAKVCTLSSARSSFLHIFSFMLQLLSKHSPHFFVFLDENMNIIITLLGKIFGKRKWNFYVKINFKIQTCLFI